MNASGNIKRNPQETPTEESCPFCRAEWKVILGHQKRLSKRRGREVALKEAIGDWLHRFSGKWRQERVMKALQDEREEILKHKWLESEKAGRDVGKDAIIDWILKHAAQWREWWEEHTDASHPKDHPG